MHRPLHPSYMKYLFTSHHSMHLCYVWSSPCCKRDMWTSQMETQPLYHSLVHSLALVQVKQRERGTNAEENIEGASALGSGGLWRAVSNRNLLSHYRIVLVAVCTTHRSEIHWIVIITLNLLLIFNVGLLTLRPLSSLSFSLPPSLSPSLPLCLSLSLLFSLFKPET